jgi:hypothetical protein
MMLAKFGFILNIFEDWGEKIKIWWDNLDPVNFWGIFLLVAAIVMLLFLVLFTEYKREERDSMKFSIIFIILIAVSGGFGLHMILISMGL